MKSVIFIVGFLIFLFQVIAVGNPSIAESELSTMTTEPKYAVRVNDLQSPAEAEKVTKIICNGKMVQSYFALTGLGIFTTIYSGDHWNFKIQVDIQNMKQENPRQEIFLRILGDCVEPC